MTMSRFLVGFLLAGAAVWAGAQQGERERELETAEAWLREDYRILPSDVVRLQGLYETLEGATQPERAARSALLLFLAGEKLALQEEAAAAAEAGLAEAAAAAAGLAEAAAAALEDDGSWRRRPGGFSASRLFWGSLASGIAFLGGFNLLGYLSDWEYNRGVEAATPAEAGRLWRRSRLYEQLSWVSAGLSGVGFAVSIPLLASGALE